MKKSVWIRLCLMMFLQYAAWGAWAPVIYSYLTAPMAEGGLGFTPAGATWFFTVFSIVCMVAPFVGGQIVDRWLPTQWFLAGAHVASALLMLFMSQQKTYASVMLAAVLFSLIYTPTIALTTSLTFHHLADPNRQFGPIRVFGTIGWVAAGWGLTAWRWLAKEQGTSVPADMLYLSAACSVAMAVLCCFLPHTPPRKEAKNPWAFLEALRLLKRRPFAIFLFIGFVVTTQLQFYYILASRFLEKGVGIARANVPLTMTVAQIAEVVVMAGLMGISLKKLGIRKTLAIGVIAWPVRFVLFATYEVVPAWVVIASLAFHGLGYTFFFTVAQVYANRIATVDIRASVQALLTLIMGLGSVISTVFTGWVVGMLSTVTWRTTPLTDSVGPKLANWVTPLITMERVIKVDWKWAFLIPCFLTVACAVAFLLFFHDPEAEAETSPVPAGGEPPAEDLAP